MDNQNEGGDEKYAKKLSKMHTAFLSPTHDFQPMLMPLPQTKFTLSRIVEQRDPLYSNNNSNSTPKRYSNDFSSISNSPSPTNKRFSPIYSKQNQQIKDFTDPDLEEYSRSIIELESECDRIEKMLNKR